MEVKHSIAVAFRRRVVRFIIVFFRFEFRPLVARIGRRRAERAYQLRQRESAAFDRRVRRVFTKRRYDIISRRLVATAVVGIRPPFVQRTRDFFGIQIVPR